MTMSRKKLLVLDVNGLLVDTYFHKEPLPKESPDAKVGNFFVYKRPFCGEFLQFCLENFVVGIWSSAREYNVNNLVDYVFRDTKEKLAFSWHQSDCTDVGLKAPDNKFKPLFLKELSKLWGKVKVDLPWSEGDYGPSNTLLVDDTPYKAILNPPNTGIFPRSYTVRDCGDDFLGCALRNYLEGIRDAASVQVYVESNPFGEPSITSASPLWSYVSKVMLKVNGAVSKVGDGIAQAMQIVTAGEEFNKKQKHHSDSLQLINNGIQSSNFNVSSEAVELHSSKNIMQPLTSSTRSSDSMASCKSIEEAPKVNSQEEVDLPFDDGNRLQIDSTNNHTRSLSSKRRRKHVKKRHANRENSSLPFETKESDGGLLKKEEPQCKENRESNGSLLEQGDQGADEEQEQPVNRENNGSPLEQGVHKGADKELHKEKQCGGTEKGNHKGVDKELYSKELPHSLEAEVDVGLDKIHEEHCNDADGHVDLGLDSLKADWIQKRGSKDERRRHHNQHTFRWHNEGGYHNRDSIRHSQDWTSKRGYYQSRGNKMPHFQQRDHRGLFAGYKQHTRYVDRHTSDKKYLNKNKPYSHNARQSQHRWSDRSMDTSTADLGLGALTAGSRSWGEPNEGGKQSSKFGASTDASLTLSASNLVTQFQNSCNDQRGISVERGLKYDEFGPDRGWGRSSHAWQEVDRHTSDKKYLNKNNPYSHNARQSQYRWSDRSMDASTGDLGLGASTAGSRSWGEANQGGRQSSKFGASTDASLAMPASNLVTQLQNRGISVERGLKCAEFGWGVSSHTSQQVAQEGFEQRAVSGALSTRSERPQHLDAYIPDSNLATLPQARWDDSSWVPNGKKRRFESIGYESLADKNAGASSWSSRSGQEQRAVSGALSTRSERPQHLDVYIPDSNLATRPQARWDDSSWVLNGSIGYESIANKNVGASRWSSRSGHDGHRQGRASRESSRNRWGQKGRNW